MKHSSQWLCILLVLPAGSRTVCTIDVGHGALPAVSQSLCLPLYNPAAIFFHLLWEPGAIPAVQKLCWKTPSLVFRNCLKHAINLSTQNGFIGAILSLILKEPSKPCRNLLHNNINYVPLLLQYSDWHSRPRSVTINIYKTSAWGKNACTKKPESWPCSCFSLLIEIIHSTFHACSSSGKIQRGSPPRLEQLSETQPLWDK